MKENIIAAIAVVALLLGAWAVIKMPVSLVSNGATKFGATSASGMLAENYIPYVLYNGGYNTAKDINTSAFLGTTGTFQVGGNTTFANLIGTTCNLVGSDTSLAATTSTAYDCAVTGVTSSFSVIAQLASSTSPWAGAPGWVIMSSKASTTAGWVTVVLANMTGANRVPSATAVGSSTVIWAFK